MDSHAHVDVSEFESDRDAMLDRARAAGVATILAIGGNPALPGAPPTLGSAIPFAERYDWIYAAAGIHPHEAALATRRALPSAALGNGAAPALPRVGRNRPRLPL